ncbi:hypothetical protein ITP53_41410 [Nonomuraea sp. K274]|uniref:Uncharacterized protein n=1 Tax=Nonomuraea cypriaca TaxID=1187855 RepID=A0A931AK74_9ACTN|nr:hypothetical protein [Nonomuraea cypriaca]MBF8192033.1 hypothetical protein [Nonomuraea cypriaca]
MFDDAADPAEAMVACTRTPASGLRESARLDGCPIMTTAIAGQRLARLIDSYR